jgi:hypothetical protein
MRIILDEAEVKFAVAKWLNEQGTIKVHVTPEMISPVTKTYGDYDLQTTEQVGYAVTLPEGGEGK